jgi:hypothetical protein
MLKSREVCWNMLHMRVTNYFVHFNKYIVATFWLTYVYLTLLWHFNFVIDLSFHYPLLGLKTDFLYNVWCTVPSCKSEDTMCVCVCVCVCVCACVRACFNILANELYFLTLNCNLWASQYFYCLKVVLAFCCCRKTHYKKTNWAMSKKKYKLCSVITGETNWLTSVLIAEKIVYFGVEKPLHLVCLWYYFAAFHRSFFPWSKTCVRAISPKTT